MDTHKFINLVILVVSSFILLEVFFLIFTKRFLGRNYRKYFNVIVFLSIFFSLSSIYLYFIEYGSILPKILDKILYIFTLTWFLPKIILIPAFIIFIFLSRVISKHNKYNKRKSRLIIVSILVPYIIVLYSSIFTTYNLKLDKKIIEIENLPYELQNLKIIHISDLHVRNVFDKSYFSRVVDLVNKQEPDLIAITGDFVSFEYSEILAIKKYLKKLRSKYGIFSCNGNHEHYDLPSKLNWFKNYLKDLGIYLLINEGIQIKINNYPLQLAAIDDINSKHNYGNFYETLKYIDTNKFTIMLAHNPDIWGDSILYETNIKLTLSGHTHGGQYGIRLGDYTLTPIRVLHKRISGIYCINEQILHISDGIGNSGAPLRFGITPKVSLLILRRKNV